MRIPRVVLRLLLLLLARLFGNFLGAHPQWSVKFFLSLRLTGSKFTKLTSSHEYSPKMFLNSDRADSADHLCRATHSLDEISSRVTVQCEIADIL